MNRTGQLWIFDMDGTLFQSELLAVPAFRTGLERMKAQGMAVPDGITDEQIAGTFGYTHDVIWEKLMGSRISAEDQALADRWILEEELEGLKRGSGALYDAVSETLATLRSEGALLAVASNGQQPYIEGIVEQFGIRELFSGLYSASGYQMKSKVDLVRLLLEEIPHHKAYMVGDRSSDVEAGRENGLVTVGCAFGFAHDKELVHAHYIVTRFPDILTLSV